MTAWLRRHRAPLLVFLAGVLVYGAVAGARLRRGSRDAHFVAQAAAWLRGSAHVDPWPAGADDPARVEEVRLDDGTVVRGRSLQSRPTFRVAGGEEIPKTRIRERLRTWSYVSFPPFPSVLFLPQALVHGAAANDVATTVLLAALAPALLLLLLARLREAGLSRRTPREDLWLAVLLGVGTVLFFSSVQGRVWYTAHVVGVVLSILYAWASVEARRPVLAGLALALAFATRTPMLFLFPLFLFEAWRMGPAGRLRRVAAFVAPIFIVGLALAAYNLARFGEPTEFGHGYLAVRQQAQIERLGLFDLRYLGRNLAVALTLLPELHAEAPWVRVSGHGLALWVTTPALLLLLWPRERGPWHRPLWITVACVAAWSLFYQNSGWFQFGYRFSLDYVVLLIVLLAVGGVPFGRAFKALVLVGAVVNLFGAVTFDRVPAVYRAEGSSYDCVVRH